MQNIVNPVIAVDQDDVIADYGVAVSRGRRSEFSTELAWHGPHGGAHLGRENETVVNFRLPIPMPIAVVTIAFSKVAAMVLIPIAGLLAIVVVESIVIVMIAVTVVMVAVVISLIVIMMVAIIVILGVSERYA